MTEIQLDIVHFLFRNRKLSNSRTYKKEAMAKIIKMKYPDANFEKELRGLINKKWVGVANKQGREALYTTHKIKNYLIEHGYQVERVVSID